MCSGKLQTALLVAGYFVYLLVGAAVFQALERTAEKQEKMAAAQMKEAFLQNFTQLTVAEMEQFMKNLIEAIQNGVYPVGNESKFEESNWDFSNSFFFAGTVVSTIVFFQITEGWSYSEGIYFAFITLSTIGFGDYVVGKQSDRKYFSYYRVLVAIWILFGLAWIALLFNLLTTVLEDTEKIIVKDLQQIGKQTITRRILTISTHGTQGNRAPEKIHASDPWLSQPGPGVLVLLTDKLDPDNGSELVDVEKIDLN
ncbi:Potassium channel subfamily K member 17 [Lonchura striata]|uniref:Potassium channel subfamily K member 17 n=1 Tax=Lonchura striata TaxID=40157 RepID=A0A218UA62_9PASE|nr:Potassium channel subfamily K member 17 [Lonchura striata domestica]